MTMVCNLGQSERMASVNRTSRIQVHHSRKGKMKVTKQEGKMVNNTRKI